MRAARRLGWLAFWLMLTQLGALAYAGALVVAGQRGAVGFMGVFLARPPRDRVIRFQGCRAARHDDHIHLQSARL